MEVLQTNRHPLQPYTGAHKDPEIQALVEQSIAEAGESEAFFHALVDNAPNYNGEYEADLQCIRDQFVEDGLDIAPIIILAPEDFDHALTASKVVPHQAIDGQEGIYTPTGIYVAGRSLVQRHDYGDIAESSIRHICVDQHVRNIALHEAAHSIGRTEDTSRTVITIQTGNTTEYRVFNANEFDKADFTKFGIKQDGKFKVYGLLLEEGFADLTRVIYSRKLGWAPKLEGPEFSFAHPQDNVAYVNNPNRMPIDREGRVRLPIDFAAQCIIYDDPEGRPRIQTWHNLPNLAAYGLELLANEVPDLHDAMLASRKDPTLQYDVIRMINSVRPGLYQDLRDLEYNDADFKKGFYLIVEALVSTGKYNSVN